jgi:hypothetical protein
MWVNTVLHCCECNSPFLRIVVNTASLLHEVVKHNIIYDEIQYDVWNC